MSPRKPPIPYRAPDGRDREPPQWWVFFLILACGAAIVLAIFLLERIWG